MSIPVKCSHSKVNKSVQEWFLCGEWIPRSWVDTLVDMGYDLFFLNILKVKRSEGVDFNIIILLLFCTDSYIFGIISNASVIST